MEKLEKDNKALLLSNKELEEKVEEKEYEIDYLSKLLNGQKVELNQFENLKGLYHQLKGVLLEKDRFIELLVKKDLLAGKTKMQNKEALRPHQEAELMEGYLQNLARPARKRKKINYKNK